jgi:hypothetical protein
MHINRAFFLMMLALTLVANAKTIETDEPTSVTGRLSLGKDGRIHISSGDIVVLNASKFPVTNVPIDSYGSPREAELKSLAAQGKTATIHGTFIRLHARGLDIYGSEIKFVLDR